MNNRRLSTSLAPVAKAADPRPIGKKAYSDLCIKTILAYLAEHKYDQPLCTTKTLQSPSKAAFQQMLTFLMRQIDPNFEFGNFEEEFRFYMKQFGYPGNLRKDALVPVGSPHTWPTVLAAVTWLVEYLNYLHTLREIKSQKLDEILVDEEAASADLNLFEYNIKAFRKFMNGDDDACMRMDEDLVRAYQEKNEQLSDEALKLQAKVNELKHEKLKFKNPEVAVKNLEIGRETLKDDLEKFKLFTAKCIAHKEQQAIPLQKARKESEEQALLLLASEEEKVLLEAALAKQQYTPLEVQEMNHQKNALKHNLDTLEAQKTAVQQEIWAQETANTKAQFELEARIKTFNECAMLLELTPFSARYARGVDFQLKTHPQRKETHNLVGVDLTRAVKPALAALTKQLISEITSAQLKLRDVGGQVTGLIEQKETQLKKVRSLEERAQRYEDAYRQEKEDSELEISALLAKIEAVELEISQMKGSQSRILEESETRIHQLDNELVEQRQTQIAARDKLVRQMRDTSERVLEHKGKITKALTEAVQGVATVKQFVERGIVDRRSV